MKISLVDRVENIVRKGELARTKDFFPRPVKRCHCVEMR